MRQAFVASVEVLTGELRNHRERQIAQVASTCTTPVEGAKWIENYRDDVLAGRVFVSNFTAGTANEMYCLHADARAVLIARTHDTVVGTRNAFVWSVKRGTMKQRTYNNLQYLHHNADDPPFRTDLFARYAHYTMNGLSVQFAWQTAFREARTQRRMARKARELQMFRNMIEAGPAACTSSAIEHQCAMVCGKGNYQLVIDKEKSTVDVWCPAMLIDVLRDRIENVRTFGVKVTMHKLGE
jgi:hypothetical protein